MPLFIWIVMISMIAPVRSGVSTYTGPGANIAGYFGENTAGNEGSGIEFGLQTLVFCKLKIFLFWIKPSY